MTANTLTNFIFQCRKFSKLWRKLEIDTKREIANRASEIKVEADFLRVLAEVETKQVSLFEL